MIKLKALILPFGILVIVLAMLVGYSLLTKLQPAGEVKTEIPKPNTIVAVGDIVCSPIRAHTPGECQDRATLDIAKQLDPTAVLLLGDLQYDVGALSAFKSGFDSTWGSFGDKLYPVPGNHEYSTSGASGYFDYFNDEGKKQGQAGERGKGYYSFGIGKWHIVALNSNCSAVGGCGSGSPQYTWLQADLATHSQTCSLAFWHHPAFSSGRYAKDSKQLSQGSGFWPALLAAKVDMVLNGHDHIYERFDKIDTSGKPNAQGIRQFTVGTGGKSLYKQTVLHAASQKLIDTTYGVLALGLSDSAYSWQFIGTDGTVLDSGSDNCL